MKIVDEAFDQNINNLKQLRNSIDNSKMTQKFAKVECDKNGAIIDSNFKSD